MSLVVEGCGLGFEIPRGLGAGFLPFWIHSVCLHMYKIGAFVLKGCGGIVICGREENSIA